MPPPSSLVLSWLPFYVCCTAAGVGFAIHTARSLVTRRAIRKQQASFNQEYFQVLEDAAKPDERTVFPGVRSDLCDEVEQYFRALIWPGPSADGWITDVTRSKLCDMHHNLIYIHLGDPQPRSERPPSAPIEEDCIL